jgi:hypothetical protein
LASPKGKLRPGINFADGGAELYFFDTEDLRESRTDARILNDVG